MNKYVYSWLVVLLLTTSFISCTDTGTTATPAVQTNYTISETRNDSAGSSTSGSIRFIPGGNEVLYIEKNDTFHIDLDKQGDFVYKNDTAIHSRYDLLAFSVGPPDGVQAAAGATWEKKWPDDAQASKDTGLTVQGIFNYTIASVQGDTAMINVDARSKFSDTKALAYIMQQIAGYDTSAYTAFLSQTFPYARTQIKYDIKNRRTINASGKFAVFSYFSRNDTLDRQEQLTTFTIQKQ